jgi:hypothetical protein
MTNKFNIRLTDEEEERYNHLKELSLRHYPKLSVDQTASNMAEYLYIYYAKHGSLPDPLEKEPSDEEFKEMINQPRIIEYKTPSDAGCNLKRLPDEGLETESV